MNRLNSGKNKHAVTSDIGPETKLFFGRYASLKANGVFETDHAEDYEKLGGDMATVEEQAQIISSQLSVPFLIAVSGISLIWSNENGIFDPLTLPPLN